MSTTMFVRRGDTFSVSNNHNLDVHDTLPVGCYTIKVHPVTEQLYFQQVEPFALPPKLYGDVEKRVSRIITTYFDRVTSTGVLLTGEKGSGKTQLARLLSVRGGEQGFVTILINDPFTGDKFAELLQAVQQPCIVLFDELEKVYDDDAQQKLLTLLDGVMSSRKLFVFTCNDKWRINDHLRNRPGRIYYMYEYKGLSTEFITEFCNDRLINKQHIGKLCTLASMFAEFNFDMLKAVVEEMNRYGETPEEVVRVLNVRPTADDSGSYKVELLVNGAETNQFGAVYPQLWSGSPLNEEKIRITFNPSSADGDDGDEPPVLSAQQSSAKPVKIGSTKISAMLSKPRVFMFDQADLVSFNDKTKTFVYTNRDGVTVKFTRDDPFQARFEDMLI